MAESSLVSIVETWLDILYVAADGAGLRNEDRRKALQVTAMLMEIERAVRHIAQRTPVVLVDAAAGKTYLGLLAARLVFERLGRPAQIVAIERDARRVAASQKALERLDTTVAVECRFGNVTDAAVWPRKPSIVAALHACGPAADAVIDRAIETDAQWLLLAPCCTSSAVAASSRATMKAERLHFPRQAPVRRRFIQAAVDAQRTWRLEAAGYQTEVVEFVGATVTPHNLLWRARRVREPRRMAKAREAQAIWNATR